MTAPYTEGVFPPPDLMISLSGVRGRVDGGMTPPVAGRLAVAFGIFSERGKVVVGRDSRPSGAELSQAVIERLRGVGCEVVDVGLCPTPTIQLAVRDLGAAGGMAVTASHNAAEWNALKFIGPDGLFLDAQASKQLQTLWTVEPSLSQADVRGDLVRDPEAVERHIEAVASLPLLNLPGLRRRKFRVVADCCHGVGGLIMGPLLARLGAEATLLYEEPSGEFPHDPEPRAENLSELGEAVANEGADLGLAVDPDVDRLALVDERGEPLLEEFTLVLAADLVLAHERGPVVTNLSTTGLVEVLAEQYAVQVFRTPVGEINVAREMERVEAVVGGEGNGGVILPILHLGRDAPVAVALILQHVLEQEKPLSALVGEYPPVAMVKRKVPPPPGGLTSLYDRLLRAYPEAAVDDRDGIRLTWPSDRRWLHVRPSGTEPVVRIIAEAPASGETQEMVGHVMALLAPDGLGASVDGF